MTSLNPATQVQKIGGIACLEELEGFEAEAKKRGILPEEMKALQQARLKLTPKKRRRK